MPLNIDWQQILLHLLNFMRTDYINWKVKVKHLPLMKW